MTAVVYAWFAVGLALSLWRSLYRIGEWYSITGRKFILGTSSDLLSIGGLVAIATPRFGVSFWIVLAVFVLNLWTRVWLYASGRSIERDAASAVAAVMLASALVPLILDVGGTL